VFVRPKEDRKLVTTSEKPAPKTRARVTKVTTSPPAKAPARRARASEDAKPTPIAAPIPAPEAFPSEVEKKIAPAVAAGFAEFGLSDEVNRAIRDMGFTRPTEIQARVIPLLLESGDVIGQAQTGTGKTAAFGIPLIEGIDESLQHTQALVLAPTRELAIQIGEELRKLAKYLPGITVATIYGGASYGRQFDDLKSGGQVVVGTPGRVLDHIGRGTLKLDSVDYLILDEADRMLDMGFLPDVERILRRIPRERQTALFSATVPTVIRILSRRYMHDPVTVHVQPLQITVEEVDQVYYEVADRDKVDGLISLIEQDTPERAMIFRQTKIGVDRLVATLRRRGLPAEAIHGDMSQKAREHVLREFREGKLTYLVATDVAARGLDIPEVSHVFNFDIPEDPDAYVHRIGRTARAGRSGSAVTFVGEWDADKLPPIQKIVNNLIQRKLLPIYERR
jgi:ATP-dependent RNA helicase DeaD